MTRHGWTKRLLLAALMTTLGGGTALAKHGADDGAKQEQHRSNGDHREGRKAEKEKHKNKNKARHKVRNRNRNRERERERNREREREREHDRGDDHGGRRNRGRG